MSMERGMRAARQAGVNLLSLTIWVIALLVGCRYLWALVAFMAAHWEVTLITVGVVILVTWIFVITERAQRPWP